MKFGIVIFPGSNCEQDCFHVIQNVLRQPVEYIWHADGKLDHFDCVILPGGFSYGDYLRAGSIARFANIMDLIKNYARRGGRVLGICNGFQILCEAGLLPGALYNNKTLRFICKTARLKVKNNNTCFTRLYQRDQIISLPIAHAEGNYICDRPTLVGLKKNRQIVFAYHGDNPNGSLEDIAGICNQKGNVLGMMPHPERASEKILGGTDGKALFYSLLAEMPALPRGRRGRDA